MSHLVKSKIMMDKEQSESSSDEDNKASKSADGKVVKGSKKSADQGKSSGETVTKTIIKDKSFLIGETIDDDAHDEHEARHRAKLHGTWETLKSEVSSSPDANVKFGEEKVDTHYSTHKNATAAPCEAVAAEWEETDKRESSKASAKAKARDGQQSEIDLDDDGFKIPCGSTKRH